MIQFDTCKINENCNIENIDFIPKKIYTHDRRICKNGWIAEYQIGEKSSSGVIYRTCCRKFCKDNNMRYVMKKVNFGVTTHQNTSSEQIFLREAEFQIRAAEHGLAPKIYQILVGDDAGILIMDMLTGSSVRKQIEKILLSKRSHSDKRKIIHNYIYSVVYLINNLHEIGILHGDTHLNNFMIESTKIYDAGDMKIIDFGLAQNVGDDKPSSDFITLYTDLGKLKNQLLELKQKKKNISISNQDLSILDEKQQEIENLIRFLSAKEREEEKNIDSADKILSDINKLRQDIVDAKDTDSVDESFEDFYNQLNYIIIRYFKLNVEESEIRDKIVKIANFLNKYNDENDLNMEPIEIVRRFGKKSKKSVKKSRKVRKSKKSAKKSRKSAKKSRKVRKM